MEIEIIPNLLLIRRYSCVLGGGINIKEWISFYRESGIFDEDQLQLISYAVKSIINDVSKLMILLSIAVLTDTVILFFVVLIPFVTVRMFLGGIHMKSYWKCFGVTVGIMFSIMFFSFCCKNNTFILLGLSVISMIGMTIVGPRVSMKKRVMSERRRNTFRTVGVMLEMIYIMIALMGIKNPMYQAGIYLTLLISNMQILILARKEKKNAKTN